MTIHRYFVSCPRGLSVLLRDELERLGAKGIVVESGGCRVRGPLEFGYRMCLWSRLASRVVLLLEDFVFESADDLYEQVKTMPWEAHLEPTGTLTVDFVGQGAGIRHSQFGAQRIKDAIVDRLRDRFGVRPGVERDQPDLRVSVHVRGRGASVGIDLSGDSLHRRGYRARHTAAPIKENLAAALVMYARWHEDQDVQRPFVDPMAGSGTVVIEAALLAADVAPGLARTEFGFQRWRGHEEEVWRPLFAQAQRQASEGLRRRAAVPLLGFDEDPEAVAAAQDNATRAGVAEICRFERRRLQDIQTLAGSEGLVACNPPYGERLGDKVAARKVFADLGMMLRRACAGWTAGVIATDDGLLHALGLPFEDTLEVANGPTPARLARISVRQSDDVDHPLWNRLRKNYKRLRKWAAREGISCFRIYDADLPEYNAAIDLYDGRAHVQEYEPPRTIEPELATRRLGEITAAVSDVLGVPGQDVHLKTRRRQRGRNQYTRMDHRDEFFVVEEGGHKFWVNLVDYLDTGLFLDHRKTRALVESEARGKRFLNLFCYTASVTVYAVAGGATRTTSVDLSNTYLDWAERNFELNEIGEGPNHRIIRADCLTWLGSERGAYDLIFVDPPTFSNSKSMSSTFDVRRDHLALLELAMARLSPTGTLIFSTNAKKFRLDREVERKWNCEPLTRVTTSQDFVARNPHQCWRVQFR